MTRNRTRRRQKAGVSIYGCAGMANTYLVGASPPHAARRPQKFLWTYERALEPRLAEELEAAMAGWADSNWPPSAKFEDVRRWVACLFGFERDVWRALEEEKSSRTRDSLVLCSADGQSRFYVERFYVERRGVHGGDASDATIEDATIEVQYHGPLAPSSGYARLAPLEQQVLRPAAELTDEELRTENALLERELRSVQADVRALRAASRGR